MTPTPLRRARDLARRLAEADASGAAPAAPSEQRLRDMIDGLGPSIFVGLMTPDGMLIEANRSALAAAGVKLEDVLGVRFDETPWWSHSPAIQADVRAAVARAARGEASRFDTNVRAADGQLIDVDFSLQPLRGADGEVAFLVPSATVITARKQTENALVELSQRTERRERMLNTTLSSISDFAYIYDRDGRFLFANQPLLDLWGITLEEAVGKNFFDLGYPPELANTLQQQVQLVFDTNARLTGETTYTSPGGVTGLYEYIFSPVRGANGGVDFVAGSGHDVSERNRATEALRASADEFRSLADAVPQIVWVTRPDGSNLYTNQRWREYTGLTPDESVGNGWTSAFHPDDQQRSQEEWEIAVATAKPYSVESRIRRADGVYRWWISRGVPQRDAEGNVVKWFGTSTDIHDLKVAQFEISRTNRALKMLSATNHTLLRAEHEQELLDQICRVAVETGGYRMAWVGYTQNDATKSIAPVARAGFAPGFPVDIAVRPDDRSVISLPLRDATRTFGMLSLHTADVDQPSAEDLKLLQDMADNLAFGIGNLRRRVEQRRVNAAIVTVAASVTASTGTEFFEQMARGAVTAVGAAAGFVAQLLPGDPPTVRTVAHVVHDRVAAGFDCSMQCLPCDGFLVDDTCVVVKDAAKLFADAECLTDLHAEGVVGHRLDSASGQPLGLMYVIFREPLQHIAFISSTLKIFAARAASELERRQTDAHVREQAALLNIAHEAIQVNDLDGRILFWNKGAERTFGWTSAEAVGRESAELLGTDAVAIAVARSALLENGEWEGELFKRAKDGRQITTDARWTLVRDEQDMPKAILAIDTDITERKTLASQLMVSDRMASMGTLAAGVAHEINNPLAAVVANLDYIAESVGRLIAREATVPGPVHDEPWIRDEISAPLDDARHAAQRVRFIVRDLMIFSRTPSDEAMRPVGVKAILESSLRMAGNEVRHRARLITEYGIVPDVMANEARLGQVFLNLIVNAAQSLPDGQAEVNEIRVRSRVQGERVIVEVTDTGPGIPPEIIGRIFDAFFTTKEVGAGTGLGLAICQRIITDMGGALTVESKIGTGTTFRVSLPAATVAEVAVVEAVEKTPPVTGRRGRILVVDDEEMVARTVQRCLSREHDVVSKVSARDALALVVAGAAFDVILCDLMMPEMTGMDFHRELAAIAPDQAQHLVLLTGGAFTDTARQFLSSTTLEQMEKPFEPAKLRALVRRYVR